MSVQTHAIFHVNLMIVIKLQLYQNVLAQEKDLVRKNKKAIPIMIKEVKGIILMGSMPLKS
jgi:hypothetical protein